MFKKRKKRKQEADQFRATVTSLMMGIHKFDEYLEKVCNEESYTYNHIAFISRSTEDLFAMCNIYSMSYFFHAYNMVNMNNYMELMMKVFRDLEPTARSFDKSLKLYKEAQDVFRKLKEACDTDDYLDELADTAEKLAEVKVHLKNLSTNIHIDLLTMRSVLLLIRHIVSRDYMKILAGIDLVEAYELEEKRIKREMSMLIRYPKKLDKKLLLTKESDDDE